MSLELDTRQRAMLQEMGIVTYAIEKIAPKAINTPATGQKSTINSQNRQATAPSPASTPTSTSTSSPAAKVALATPQTVSHSRPAPQTPAVPAVLPELPTGLPSMDWPALQQAAATCQSCHLCTSRKNAVLGISTPNLQAECLVVGDPPSESDEMAGTPFTGEAAAMLNNMLSKVLGFDPATQVCITNAVKCRSSGLSTGVNELAQCAHFLRRQIALVQPKIILAMGRYAAQALLQQDSPEALGKLRSVVHRIQVDGRDIPVVVTYTPQLLLKTPADKVKAMADLKLAKQSV